MDDVSRFLYEILWNWWTLVSGVLLVIEPTLKAAWPDYDDWASRVITEDRRRAITKCAAIVAFVIANYLAFHGAKIETREAEQKLAVVQSSDWRLTSEQAEKMIEQVKKWPANKPVGIVSVGDAASQRLALQFMDIFKTRGIKNTYPGSDTVSVSPIGYSMESPAEKGIMISVADANDPPPDAKVLMNMLRASGIDARYVGSAGWASPTFFALYIGPRG